jgi:putative ABC transport system ATP-binding protein
VTGRQTAGPAVTTAPAEAPMVVARDVTRTFGRGVAAVRALRGVSLTVGRGQLVALCGRSGIGQDHPAEHRGRAGPSRLGQRAGGRP